MMGPRARVRIFLRRTPLLAAAGVLALLAALFASSAPTQAAEGDLSATSGWCMREGNNNRVTTTHNSTGEPQLSYHKVRNANNEWVNINCPSELAGLRVNLEPNGTVNPKITIRDPWLDLWLSETYVQPGTTVSLTMVIRDGVDVYSDYGSGSLSSWDFVTYSYLYAASMPDATLNGEQVSLRVDYLYSSPGLRNPVWPDGNLPRTDISDTSGPALKNPDGRFTWTIPVPHGTTPGEYTVSASFTWDEYSGDGWPGLPGNPLRLRTVKNEVTLHVVEEFPVFVADATLELGNARGDDAKTLANELVAEDGTEPADGGDINVRITTLDADGERPEDRRIGRIQVLAAGGAVNGNAGGATLTGDSARAQTGVRITKPDGQPGTVEVRAIVLGASGGLVETETLTLTFTGPPATLVLGDGVSIGQPAANTQTQRELSLSAMDAGGNSVNTPANVAYQVTDADGREVNRSIIRAETSTVGASTDSTRDDTNAPAVLLTVDDTVEPGVYTVTASLPGQADSADTATLTIAGAAANLALTTDTASGTQAGQLITVTATATDAGGANVADGSDVTFSLTGTSLYLVGTDANPAAAGAQRRTANGVATAQFAVVDDGSTVISAVIDSQTAVLVIENAIMAAPAVEEEPEPTGVDCLSGQSGFVSWTCSTSTNASTLLAELTGRAVAVHLYNGQRWIRYSEVNGRVVPGSTDFMIFDNDVLYISN